MTVDLHRLSPVEKTLLVTLASRTADARSDRPLLGDHLAETVSSRLPPNGVTPSGIVAVAVAVRSAILDRFVRGLLAEHPDGIVVELGCGLETWMHRVAPPERVDWYDIDLPAVIALRAQALPELDRSHLIAASLTESGWLDGVPRERPAIVVADGVLGFLTEAENRQILGTVTDHFTSGGELVFNAYSRTAHD